jgi:hypothetical protein
MTSSSSTPIHSTGRGGAGNIGPDETIYTDGDIVREGTPGASHHAEYSAGRGGAGMQPATPIPLRNPLPLSPHLTNLPPTGNIVQATSHAPSNDSIPEPATRPIGVAAGAEYEDFHTGRGGQGNVHRERFGGHSSQAEQDAAEAEAGGKREGLIGKVVHAMGLDREKEREKGKAEK